jgi:hypothetical protein
MDAKTANETVLTPALLLLPERMDTTAARRMLLAIGLQESRLIHRRQIRGPARGLWQFEEGGGCLGVLRHPASARLAEDVCLRRQVTPEPRQLYLALADDDVLAAAMARLLLWTDPAPLPEDAETAWAYYLRTWRPGKPHPHTWPGFWRTASEAVT